MQHYAGIYLQQVKITVIAICNIIFCGKCNMFCPNGKLNVEIYTSVVSSQDGLLFFLVSLTEASLMKYNHEICVFYN